MGVHGKGGEQEQRIVMALSTLGYQTCYPSIGSFDNRVALIRPPPLTTLCQL